MIISNSKGFVFIHIPKAAGTTVTLYFSQFSTCLDIEIGGTQIGERIQPYYIERYGLSKHSTFPEIKSALSENLGEKFFSFAIVRNPYERLVSTFKFLKQWKNWPGQKTLDNVNDINEFVQSNFFQSDGPDRILKPQTFWLTNPSQPNDLLVSYVGRVEELDLAMSDISERLGLPWHGKTLDKKNSSDKTPGNAKLNLDFDKKSMKLISEKYKTDFDLFSYELR